MSIIYKSKRIGRYGKEFTLYKLRTMIEGADKIGGSSTSADDKRLTKIGKFLRKWKIDETLQFFNLLKGDMKIIGWRPEALEYLHTIPKEILNTKPGIIGLATLWDIDEGEVLKGKEDPDKYYEEEILPLKRKLDLYYIRNKSLSLDIKIITATVLGVFRIRKHILLDNIKEALEL